MKKILIPLIDKSVRYYVGKDEFKAFWRMAKNCGYSGEVEECPEGKGKGLQWLSVIWVFEPDVNTLTHETQHFLDDLFYFIGCETEKEFKGYISGYVHERLFKLFPPS